MKKALLTNISFLIIVPSVKLFSWQQKFPDFMWGRAARIDETNRYHGGSQESWMGYSNSGFGVLFRTPRPGAVLPQKCSRGETQRGISMNFM